MTRPGRAVVGGRDHRVAGRRRGALTAAAVPVVIAAARVVAVAVLVVQMARRMIAVVAAVVTVPGRQFAPERVPAVIPPVVIAQA